MIVVAVIVTVMVVMKVTVNNYGDSEDGDTE